jgi:hypothetical protein
LASLTRGRAVEHHDAGRQGVEQQDKTFGQRFLLLVLPAQLAIGDRQFGGQRLDAALQPLVRLGQACETWLKASKARCSSCALPFMADVFVRLRSSNGKSRAFNSYNSR